MPEGFLQRILPDGRGALVETPDGKGYVQTVDGQCARCCGDCRRYYKLVACTVNTPTVCGIVPVEPPPIYLWTGAKCEFPADTPVVPGKVVFLAGRCWRVTALEFNDRNGTCPEPRVPQNAQVFDDLRVPCIADGCEARLCQDALEGFVQAMPCGPIQGDQVVHYTCRSYLPRCFVTKILANPNDSNSSACYTFDPAGPAVNPSLLPPTAVFWGFGIIQAILGTNPPDSCCACEAAERSGTDILSGHCDYGNAQNTRQTINGLVDLGEVSCCCGRAEDWNNAQITISEWVEEQTADTGSTVFLTRVSLDQPLTFRNADAVSGIEFVVIQRDYVNGSLVNEQPITLRIFFQLCGRLSVEDFGSSPAFQLATDFIERRNTCTSGSYRHQFGVVGNQFTKRWTITAQFRDALSPCSGGCGGRTVKGGVGGSTNTGGGSSGTVDMPYAFNFL